MWIGVAAHAVADDLGQDRRAAGLGELVLLEDQDAGAFADDESVAVLVPRAAGALGLVIARGQRAHGGESADAHRRDGGFGAAADHDIGVAALDHLEGIADAVRAGGAGGGGGRVRPLAPVRIDTCPEARLTMVAGMKKGEIRPGPFSSRLRCSRSITSKPPMPLPM